MSRPVVRSVIRLLLVVSWLTVACGPKATRTGASPEDAIVYIRSNVRDAQLFVDGKFVAPLDKLAGGVALDPGLHRLELRHEDYFSSYVELQVDRSERKRIAIEMAGILP